MNLEFAPKGNEQDQNHIFEIRWLESPTGRLGVQVLDPENALP